MITVNVYPSAHDLDALAAKGERGSGKLQKARRPVQLRTDSGPRTPDRPAEHFIAVIFGRPNFIEPAFARFKLAAGVG